MSYIIIIYSLMIIEEKLRDKIHSNKGINNTLTSGCN